ncbi:hypothetical protein FHS43_000770 [Streptosporangium becharense]|uniref:Uncharacterized protein n=1 Tax=Streptosporangium becharense TaxID=1816182 RepID=A0A7W9IG87_9ACTN|nr:hypothetical protein [Streptosporangium becharense]MBB2909524.1 hypothetical protein [Streptosporangium becharense]MBB5819519.1 hypothetical protein [Streptosporangium becharense]
MDNHRAVPLAVNEATVENDDKALVIVQRLLRERGVRSQRHHTISLGLFPGSEVTWPDRPMRSRLDRYPPELTVIDSGGRQDATVTMGLHSGCYLVSLREDPDPHTVPRKHPEKVVELILAARSECGS